jgi:disulfide bond formation protein DsbB
MNRFLRLIAPALIGAAAWAAITHCHSPAAQADSTYSYATPPPKFIFRSALLGASFLTMRMDATTGDCWFAANGKWGKYAEETPPGPGAYDLQLMPMPDGKTYQMVRTDLISGRAWYVVGTKWAMWTEQ